MKGLESFILSVTGFNDLTASKKIDFFAYYLLIEQKANGFTVKDIAECFDNLHLEPYSNISSYLGNNSKGKSKKFLKKNGSYYLERTYKENLDSGFGKISIHLPHRPRW